MPDVFDRIAPAAPAAGGDVFDRIAPAAAAPAPAPAPPADVFDRVAPPPAPTPSPEPTPAPAAAPAAPDVFDRVASRPPSPAEYASPGWQASNLVGPLRPYAQELRNEEQRTIADPRETAAIAQRAAADQAVAKWFDRNADLADYRPGQPDPLRDRVAADPFPKDELRLLDPQQAAGWQRRLHEDVARPRIQAGQQLPEGWHVPEHLAATWRAEVPAVAQAAGAAAAERGVDVLGGFRAVPGVNYVAGKLLQARTALRGASGENLAQARAIKQGLPQTPAAQFVTGQANMLGQMGAAAAATGLTGNPAVGAAAFSGLFAADAASQAYANAKQQGRGESDALEDAAFSGVKAAIVARIPMSWPALAREAAATRMAGAYLAGTAITTGDAAVDQAWRSAVRGEKLDQAALERVGEAFLTGGLPAAAIHGAHEGVHALKEAAAAPTVRTAEPPLPARPEGTPEPQAKVGDYYPGNPQTSPGELDAQPIGTLRRLARSEGIDYRLPREELITKLRERGSQRTADRETADSISRPISREEPATVDNTEVKDGSVSRETDRVAADDDNAPLPVLPQEEIDRVARETRPPEIELPPAEPQPAKTPEPPPAQPPAADEGTPAAAGGDLYDQAVAHAREAGRASVSLLQRKMNIGYSTAVGLIDRMVGEGIAGPYEPGKGRQFRPVKPAGGDLDGTRKDVTTGEPPVPPGMVRMYHGGTPYEGGSRWLTPDRAYAEGYANNGSTGKGVYYVDLPEDSPHLRKSFDDTGTDQKAPPVAFDAPEEIARNLRPLTPAADAAKAPDALPPAQAESRPLAEKPTEPPPPGFEIEKPAKPTPAERRAARAAAKKAAPAEAPRDTIPAETPDALPRTPGPAADDQAGDRRPADAVPPAGEEPHPERSGGEPRDRGRADVPGADERGARDGDSGAPQGAEAPDGGDAVVGREGAASDAARAEPGDRVPAGGRDDGGDRGRAGEQPDAGRGAAPAAGGDQGERADRAAKPEPGSDFLAPAGSLKREGSWLETARRNVQIIKLVKQLEAEGRRATPEEQALIAKYTGFGASEIANGLFPVEYEYGRGGRKTPTDRVNEHAIDKAWRPLYDELKATLSDEELRTIRRSTQYAHYTSEGVIRGIWDAARRMGFGGGKVLEPGMGSGLFMVAAPPDLAAKTKYVGVEMDHLTAAIAKQLLQTHNVIRNNYVDQKLPDDFFDAAFGNPPFSGRVKIESDPRYRKQRFALHDYFFAKTIDKVRPGGLVAFVTSRYTMDKVDDAARTYLADRADLLGAIRLPQTAFKANAGTEVVTDVLFLRKRLPGEAPAGEKWLGTDEIQTPDGPARVNQYFADHPDMVLGQHALKGSMYRENEYTVLPPEGDVEEAFAKAVKNLPENVYRPAERAGGGAGGGGPRPAAELAEQAARADFDVSGHKEGGVYVADDGTVMQVRNGVGVTIPIPLKPKEKAWLTGYVGVRDALKTALADQLADSPDWEASRAAAVKAYRAHVKEHGRLLEHTLYTRELETADGEKETRTYRRFKWNRLLSSTVDADVSTVMGLEKLRDGSNVVDDGDFLSGRVLKPREPAAIKGPADALAVSLADRGRLDLDHVAELLKVKTPEEAAEALGNLVYDEPGKGTVTADEYLSGDVVAKLDEAKAAAATDPRYQRNVEGLLKVQPQPLGTDQVLVRLGANWIPPKVVGDFASEVLGMGGGVDYLPAGNIWSLNTGGRGGREAGAEWGTSDRSAGEILHAILNNQELTVRYPKLKDGSGGGVNQEATTAVNEIADRMRERFAQWFWTDGGRAKEMLELYNRRYNNLAPRNFDGSKMTFPGMSLRFELHPHQKRAIWRVVQTGNTYLAHAVGAGKTLEMIVSGMEQRRLGLVKKPMYVVPNHMLEQFSNEFADAYPAAKVLVADEDNFTGDERKRFVAKAALNDWDAVVIKQSSFKKIGVKAETAKAVADDILSELRAALDDTGEDDRTTRKRLEAQIEAVEQRVAKLATSGGEKDNNLAFEDLGVDYLYVDEAHLYRKLDFSTNRKVKGIDGTGSGYAFDLFAKLRHLASKRPDRYATLASGTPITNTLAELYTVQRYLDYEGLRADNLHAFDAWANMFGSVHSEWERNAIGGYEKVERFAKFVNVPELMSRVRRFMDVLTMDQLGELVKRPDLEGGKPEMRVANPSPALKAYMNGPLKDRLLASKAWKPSREEPNNPDPVIAIATTGRLAALDLRLAVPNAANDPKSKLNLMIDRIIEQHAATKDNVYNTAGKPDPLKGGAQIVFSAVGFGDAMADRGFSPRKWVVKRLTEAGIPSSEVAFMGDYTSDAQKEQLFKDMREGRKRILIGSPKNMGTGVNVQKRLTDLHFLAPPWYPADVEQPHGRILRQGNQNDKVRIGWYVTEGTYDSTMWGMIRRKGQAIEQAFRGEGARSVEDISEVSAYTMAEAVASGDNRVIELAELQAKAEKLRRLEQAHHTDQRQVAVKVHNLEGYLKDRRRALEKAKASSDAIDKVDNWWAPEVRVGGTAYDKPGDAGEALMARAAKLNWSQDGPPVEMGTVGGFPVEATPFLTPDRGAQWSLAVRVAGTTAELGTIKAGDTANENAVMWGSRMKRSLSTVRDRTSEVEGEVKQTEAEIKKFKPRVGAPFERKAELSEAIANAAKLQEEIAAASNAANAAEQAKPPAAGDAVVVGDEPAESKDVKDVLTSPPSGKLDQMESWARKQLDDMGGTGLRGGLIPVDPIQDAKRLALHAVIGAARIGKGAQRFVTWSRKMLAEIPDLAAQGKEYLRKVWAHARRIHRMGEDDRAAYVMRAFTQGGDEGTMTTLRKAVGLVKDRTAVISQLDALRGQLRAEQRGATRGYYQGVRDVTGLRRELARIVRENLPPELQGRFLENVAQVRTPGQMALALNKGKRMLADYDVRQALSDLEDLTGTLKINVVRPKPGKAGEPKPPRVLGDVDPASIRKVDLKTLPPDTRKEVGDLVEQARYLKDRLRAAAGDDVTVEEKNKAADAFRAIDRQIRQAVANHLAATEIRVGDRLVQRDDLVKQIVGAVGAGDEAGSRTSEARAVGGGLRNLFGRQALSMDAIATNMVGPDSDAYRLTIDDVRRAQSAYHSEQRRTHEAFEAPLEAAGIPAESKRLNDWLTKREPIDVPGVGPVKMTRDEMLDLVAMASDPQTKKLVEQGIRWTFAGNPRETPLHLSPEAIEAIRGQLTPGELGLLKAFRARSGELTGPAMMAKLELSGWAPTPHEGYYPRSRNRMQGEEAGLPEGWRGYMDRALENISSTEARAQDKKLPLSVKGFMSRAFTHFDDQAKLIHLAEPVRNAASVWEHPEVTRALGRKYGESMNERVGQFLRDTMMVRTGPPPGVVGRVWQRVARNVARAWLQANPSPMAKNVLGGTVSLLPEFDVRDWAHGVGHMMSPAVYRRMLKGSGVAWERYHGGLYGAYAPLTGGRTQTVAALSLGEAIKARKFGDAIDALPFMEWADSVPLRAAWAASEAFVDRTRPKLTGDARTAAVAEKFERALYRTQNGTSSTEASGFTSTARGNPLLSAYLMFKSDSAKKYSLMAMMAKADTATKGKTLLAVALNALLAAGVGYGLKRGAAAVGRAIGGTEDDPEQLQKDRMSTLWNGVKDVVGIAPIGNAFMDLARPLVVGRGTSNPIDNPVLQAGTDLVEGLQRLGQAVTAWAKTDEGAKRDKKYGEMLRALGRLAAPAATAAGVPLPPAINLARRARQAATFEPPDPRTEEEKAAGKLKASVRDALPTNVRSLVSERAKLHALSRDKLTAMEKERLARLDGFERTYQDKLKELQAATAAGDQAAANRIRRELSGAAAGVATAPVDPRAVKAADKAFDERQLHESLPKEVRDLASERGRLAAIPLKQRTPEERARLYRLGIYETFYAEQLKRIRLARERGDTALEQRARENLLARAKAFEAQSGR